MRVNRTQLCNDYYTHYNATCPRSALYTLMYTVWMKNEVIPNKVLPVFKSSPVFRIRIH